MILHQYDIATSPEIVGKKRGRLVQLLLESEAMAPHQGNLATDFRSTLISKTKFPDIKAIKIQYRSEGEDEPVAGAIQYDISVKHTKTLTVDALVDYLNSTNLGQSFGDKQELTNALNIFLNHYAKSANNLATIGSSKSFSLNQHAARGDLGAGLEVIRGFFSRVRMATCRILVNINVSHGAFYQAGSLRTLMNSYGTRNTAALEKFLRMVRVQTIHLPEKRNKANKVIPRIKTIFGLAGRGDGQGMAHPPRVRGHGAGAKDVEFWLDGDVSTSSTTKTEAKGGAKGKGRGKGNTESSAPSSSSSGAGKYISVFDFFRTSTLFLHIH